MEGILIFIYWWKAMALHLLTFPFSLGSCHSWSALCTVPILTSNISALMSLTHLCKVKNAFKRGSTGFYVQAHHIQHHLSIHNSGAEKCNSSPVWPFHLSLNLSLEQENQSALSTWSCDGIVIYPSSLSIPGFRELVLVLWSLCSRENSPQQFCKTRS